MNQERKPWVVAVDGIDFMDARKRGPLRLIAFKLWELLRFRKVPSKGGVMISKNGWMIAGGTSTYIDGLEDEAKDSQSPVIE